MTKAKKSKVDLSLYDTFVAKRPEHRYEIVGKKTLLGKLGLARPGHGWDIVDVRKVASKEYGDKE